MVNPFENTERIYSKKKEDNVDKKELRMAKCTQCREERPSEVNLPWFEERPKEETDDFYDGCRGWD